MRYFVILLMFLTTIFASCQRKVVGTGPWVKKIDSEELSKIVINFSVKMKIDKHLELEDSWAEYDDYITCLCLQYSSQRLLLSMTPVCSWLSLLKSSCIGLTTTQLLVLRSTLSLLQQMIWMSKSHLRVIMVGM